MNKIEEFLDTLKIHNKDISCFNDHLAVFKLKRLIEAEITSAVSEAVEEQKEKDAEIVKSYFKKDNALVRAMCIEIREQKWVKRPYEKNISAKAILESG